jgi:hypothetical protein
MANKSGGPGGEPNAWARQRDPARNDASEC